jgi:hypothetical protein
MEALKARLDRHFVACSAVAATAAVAGTAQQSEAAIVYRSTPVAIPGTFAGTYLNVFTGVAGANTTPGWDLNPYYGGVSLFQDPAAGWVGSGGQASLLAPGTLIGPASSYLSGGGFPNSTTAFTAGTPGLIGFKFSENGNTYFGWAHLNKASSSAGTGFFVDYAFDDSPNTAILAGAVPAPAGSIALLALGAAGLAGRRRK